MKKDFYFSSADGHSRAHGILWMPDGKIRGVLQLIHGMVEYIDRYDEFAAYMNTQGFVVIGHDHLGHGATAASKEDFGYFGEEKGMLYLLKDIYYVSRLAKRKAEEWKVPFFILGHSMGSLLLRRYITIWGDVPDGVILMGTAQYPSWMAKLGSLLACGIDEVKGADYRSKLLYALTNGSYEMKFGNKKRPGSWLTRDEAKAEAYEEHEWCGFRFTASAYHELFRLMKDLADQKDFDKIPRNLPVLMLSGMEDPVGGFTKGVLEVYNVFTAMGMEDVDIRFYLDDRHELLNELDRALVFDDIRDWLELHMEV